MILNKNNLKREFQRGDNYKKKLLKLLEIYSMSKLKLNSNSNHKDYNN